MISQKKLQKQRSSIVEVIDEKHEELSAVYLPRSTIFPHHHSPPVLRICNANIEFNVRNARFLGHYSVRKLLLSASDAIEVIG
jgi:hypothetical protein